MLQALEEVEPAEPNRDHLGLPFITAYQLAIKVDRILPELTEELGVAVGGEGTGQHNSLTSYLAHQLSQRIKDPTRNFGVEGAQLSNVDVAEMSFRTADGEVISSSNVGARYDLSMFRLRR
ncbi:hypothetical protein [Kibdelosporangium aridum]|uniref:hypothetical protein n=1 Tax=Kibdelosporangium aridum TaxID=2030 RepID=UPI0009FBC20B|nr:hypothetical protein [Kibdelosporangium aridum]